MQLEDYFDFNTEPCEHIRIKGTRVDLAFVVERFKLGDSVEQLAERFHSLELVQIYATLTYYLQNQESVDAYIARTNAAAVALQRDLEARQPITDAIRRIRAIKTAHAAVAAEGS